MTDIPRFYACAVCLDTFTTIEAFDAHRAELGHGYARPASVRRDVHEATVIAPQSDANQESSR